MELHLTKNDFKLDWFSGKGAGGQHRNKHQNCCRITHIESGLKATGQNSKSRADNQREAFNNLTEAVLDWYGITGQQKERNSSSNVVRTYHFERNVASDGEVDQLVQPTLDGKLEPFITNRLKTKPKLQQTGR